MPTFSTLGLNKGVDIQQTTFSNVFSWKFYQCHFAKHLVIKSLSINEFDLTRGKSYLIQWIPLKLRYIIIHNKNHTTIKIWLRVECRFEMVILFAHGDSNQNTNLLHVWTIHVSCRFIHKLASESLSVIIWNFSANSCVCCCILSCHFIRIHVV